jgi:tRNA(fMet)-specific endonuclease VapC
MKYLLDSNVCISFLRGRTRILQEKFTAVSATEKAVCTPVKAELYYGAYRSQDPQKNLNEVKSFFSPFVSLPFDDSTAEIFAQIRADLAVKGMLIGPYDLQIASIALANGLTLVTHNTSEFIRVPGLNLVDWEI